MTLDADLDALLATSSDGVAFDGLRVERRDDGYVVETPAIDREGLSTSEARDALKTAEPFVTNWRYWQETIGGEGTARRAFLRWCERAPVDATADGVRCDASADEPGAGDGSSATAGGTDRGDDPEWLPVPDRYAALRSGVDRRWGQLCVTARLVDEDEPSGTRVYDLRHEADDGRDLSELRVCDEPREARDLAVEDADGRYRPLKSAPTLVSGWAFTGLSGAELVEAIEFVYPATIANWHLERRGRLDVDHWLETAERQTGIYDVVDELPREAVEWMAEACCVDSQCLRRREWHYDADDELAVDGGSGVFPCREPCSLVIEAARTWTGLEAETERTWELQLTRSERDQLEALIDAVAEGRIDEVREADFADGANRYRARYLRASRFDDEGHLQARDVGEADR